jgi:hypothetical protein
MLRSFINIFCNEKWFINNAFYYRLCLNLLTVELSFPSSDGGSGAVAI